MKQGNPYFRHPSRLRAIMRAPVDLIKNYRSFGMNPVPKSRKDRLILSARFVMMGLRISRLP